MQPWLSTATCSSVVFSGCSHSLQGLQAQGWKACRGAAARWAWSPGGVASGVPPGRRPLRTAMCTTCTSLSLLLEGQTLARALAWGGLSRLSSELRPLGAWPCPCSHPTPHSPAWGPELTQTCFTLHGLMGRPASGLTLSWALGQLSRQLGGAGCKEGLEVAAKTLPQQQPSGSTCSLSCMVSTGGAGGPGKPKERGPRPRRRVLHTLCGSRPGARSPPGGPRGWGRPPAEVSGTAEPPPRAQPPPRLLAVPGRRQGTSAGCCVAPQSLRCACMPAH